MHMPKRSCLKLPQLRVDGNHAGCMSCTYENDPDWISHICVLMETTLDTCTCQNDPAWISHSCVLTETTLDTCTCQNDPDWNSHSCVLTETTQDTCACQNDPDWNSHSCVLSQTKHMSWSCLKPGWIIKPGWIRGIIPAMFLQCQTHAIVKNDAGTQEQAEKLCWWYCSEIKNLEKMSLAPKICLMLISKEAVRNKCMHCWQILSL